MKRISPLARFGLLIFFLLSGLSFRSAPTLSQHDIMFIPTRVQAGTLAELAGTGQLSLNSATQVALEALPSIGPKTAQRIIAFRERRLSK